MQVILFQNVEKLGMQGDVVSVAAGYYRNFLGPRGIAVEASEGNMRQLEMKRGKLKAEAEKQIQEAEGFARRIAETRIEFTAKATREGRLFGAIHDRELVDALKAQDIVIERRQILLPEPLKSVGTHSVRVRLLGHVETTLTVQIHAEEIPVDEDELRARRRQAPAEAEAETEAAAEEAPAEE